VLKIAIIRFGLLDPWRWRIFISPETSGTSHPKLQRGSPEDVNPLTNRWDDLKSDKLNASSSVFLLRVCMIW